jgi:hypothetical protein
MKTLDQAWDWYARNRRLLLLMSRLGRRYWKDLPWEEMEKDDHFRSLEGLDVQRDADAVLSEFDDIAIFVFFSVFEAMVLDHVWEDVKGEVSGLKHPALRKVAVRMRDGIEEGSFYSNVLELFKNLDHDLIEAVNQVRRYRNWVAHGRREDKKPTNMSPGDTLTFTHLK